MEYIIIRDSDGKYLGLNATRHTTTGWKSSFEEAHRLVITTDRKMIDWWYDTRLLSFNELTEYILVKGRKYEIVYSSADLGTPESYEFW